MSGGRTGRRLAMLAAAAAAWALVAGPAGGDPGPSAAISVAFQYAPGDDQLPPPAGELHVDEGDTLLYWNLDPVDHSITELDPPSGATRFDSGLVAVADGPAPVDGIESLEPGTYRFFCLEHESMRGTLVVDPAY